jgi:flavin-dependent dehydrogenase
MEPTVAIVGARPAGITAAYQLAQNGVKVDLYEKSKGNGHKTYSIEGTQNGYRWDMGTCFTNASYTHLRSFMKKTWN